MVLIQKYYKRFLGKTLLQKGYSPNPFPKTLNDFYPPDGFIHRGVKIVMVKKCS